MSNVLVTGGTGLVGAHLIEQLAQAGVYPTAIYRNKIPTNLEFKANWVKADLTDIASLEDALVGIEQVYHVAGYVAYRSTDRKMLYKINVEGTANLVNACLGAHVKRLIHVSSVAALGRIREGAPITEQMQWTSKTSNSEYGRTKYLGELEAWRGYAEGLEVVVVNPVIVLGEHGDWSSSSMQIFQSIKKGFPWYTMGTTGFVDANDVARAMILLMNSSVNGEKFILSAENLSYRDLFFMVADAYQVPRPKWRVTPILSKLAVVSEGLKSWFTSKKPLVTSETAKTGLTHSKFNNSKLLSFFPDFKYTPLPQTIQRICALPNS